MESGKVLIIEFLMHFIRSSFLNTAYGGFNNSGKMLGHSQNLMLFQCIQGTHVSYSASVPNQPPQLRGNIYKRHTITIPLLQFDGIFLLPLERG